MDISVIDGTKVTTTHGLFIGKDSAPVKIIEFMNVRCPYCKQWFNESLDLLADAVKQGKVQRVIKLFDKEKESLQRGNVMHRYIDYQEPEKALTALQQMFDTQDQWGNRSLTEVATFAENTLKLTAKDNTIIASEVIAEAQAATIQFVPTIVIGNHIFDESISEEQLLTYLNENKQ